ncbi:MAG TPA: cobalamin/Fe(3+)-siderophore ABC transporter ATP-binding protein [Acidimicrobiaceae bacterium]|nr:cobalamin/Fe(3+)-siderophore ABC transporter ATP-binding protein [Acidimicrobiaceae bacterium]|tara:strand:+ start:657 stop:1460 length:804 start_codon:yes stop_codon:yes gene_type:complete
MVNLETSEVVLSYGSKRIVDDLDFVVPEGKITAIIGPNGSGKSTCLRGLARVLRPVGGMVLLNGRDIHDQSTKAVAKRIGLLPQGPTTPSGVTVLDLVRRGRYPHQRLFDQWSTQDEIAVKKALVLTGLQDDPDEYVDHLSGGQRQRAWIAMALAQETDLMLLDEPTTHLDIAHQVEVLDLLRDLNRSEGRTIVMVLHDINQGCRYADHVVAMNDGKIVNQGAPQEVVNGQMMEEVFGLAAVVIPDPVTGTPLCVPDIVDKGTSSQL